MKFLKDSSGDLNPYIVAGFNILITTIFIILFVITISMASTARAFWWNDNPLDKLIENYNDSTSSLITSELKVRQDKRRLFNDHCDLLEFKATNNLPIEDQRFLDPCQRGSQIDYYKIKEGEPGK